MDVKRVISLAGLLALCALLASGLAGAQEVTGTPGSPDATITIDGKQLPPPPDKQFGGKIVFHGGIDTQQVLPTATPEEVAKHAAYVIQTLGSKGGYIFSPSQLLGPDIPLENILAMYNAVENYNAK